MVYLSRAGVDRRDNFMIKMNPFLKIDQWYAAEQAVTNWCSSNNVECSVIRTGALDVRCLVVVGGDDACRGGRGDGAIRGWCM